MSKVKYDVMAKTGEYQKDGETKARWLKCGVVIQTDKGFCLKMEAIPLVSDGFFSLFEPRQPAQLQQAKPADTSKDPFASPPNSPMPDNQSGMDDDIPF